MLRPDALPAFLLGLAEQRLRSPPTRRPDEGRAPGPGDLPRQYLLGSVPRLCLSPVQLPAIGQRVAPLLSPALDRRRARFSGRHPALQLVRFRFGSAPSPAGGGEPPVQARQS